jgi:lambda family phage portal protein
MSLFDWFRSALLPRDAPVQKTAKRMYESARPSRLTAGWVAGTSSADTEIRTSLTNLRARSRQLCRDTPYAKRARILVVNNVIGSGIGLQAQVKSTRSDLRKSVNDAIEHAWKRWSCAEFCHTGGTLHFSDFERALISEVFEAGEVFVRMHMASFGGSDIPFALELIESERVPHEFQTGQGSLARMGIEVDQYFRPIRYWIRDRHPSDIQPGGMPMDQVRPVPAAEIIHLRLVERWPQTRGVPWLHAVAATLNNMAGYSEAEIVAARAAAQPIGWEEPSDFPNPEAEQQEDGTFETPYEPGFVHHGKKLNFYSPNRPNTALPDFIRHMLKEAASGIGYGVRYAALSGDYSQANYSSERAAILDDRDGWRALQQFFIRSFRYRTHRMWLQQGVFAQSIPGISVSEYMADREKFEAVKFKPRGWNWIDPPAEVEAYKDAEKAGYITKTRIIEMTSDNTDIEDVFTERRRELDAAEELDLHFDTDPEAYAPEKPEPVAEPAEADDEPDDDEVIDEEGEQQRMRVVK